MDMPGWYCSCGESVHSGDDMKVYDQALSILKEKKMCQDK